jgi:hypothetical protein
MVINIIRNEQDMILQTSLRILSRIGSFSGWWVGGRSRRTGSTGGFGAEPGRPPAPPALGSPSQAETPASADSRGRSPPPPPRGGGGGGWGGQTRLTELAGLAYSFDDQTPRVAADRTPGAPPPPPGPGAGRGGGPGGARPG